MISKEYRNELINYLDTGKKPRSPKTLQERFALIKITMVLRNRELFDLDRQIPKLRNGLELEFPPGVNLHSLR